MSLGYASIGGIHVRGYIYEIVEVIVIISVEVHAWASGVSGNLKAANPFTLRNLLTMEITQDIRIIAKNILLKR